MGSIVRRLSPYLLEGHTNRSSGKALNWFRGRDYVSFHDFLDEFPWAAPRREPDHNYGMSRTGDCRRPPRARLPPFCSLRNIEQAIFLHIARAKLPAAADGCVIVQVSVRQAKLRHSSEVAAAAPRPAIKDSMLRERAFHVHSSYTLAPPAG